MIISTHWLRHALKDYPYAWAHVEPQLSAMTATRPLAPGDTVTCISAADTETADMLTRGTVYTVTDAQAWWVTLAEHPGQRFDACRFVRPIEGADPVTDLLNAIDRGSWADTLEARKAFK